MPDFCTLVHPCPRFPDNRPPRTVFALTDAQLNELYANGVYYYNPYSEYCSDFSTGEYNGETSGELTREQVKWVVKWHDLTARLAVEFGIPWETAMAQSILESSSNGVPGTSRIARDKHNFHGINAVNSSPYASAFAYTDDVNGWIGYFHNIARTQTYRSHGVFKDNAVTDPYAYLEAVKAAGYATDRSYIPKNSNLIAKIIKFSKSQNWASSEQLAKENPSMLDAAAALAGGAKPPYERLGAGSTSNPFHFNYVGIDGKGEGGGIVSNDVCQTGGNGDINATALALSWPKRQTGPWSKQPVVPEYATALKETGIIGQGDNCSDAGASCDAFVAAVMRYSGVDENFHCCGAANALRYMSVTNAKDYEEIDNIGNTSNLQPGDIRSKGSHIEIVVQLENGEYRIASASHCDRTSDHSSQYYADSAYRIFRHK